MHSNLNSHGDARRLHIAMAVSRYHEQVTESLQSAAAQAFEDAGGDRRRLLIAHAPGTFELTAVCDALARLKGGRGRPALDAIVAIGCVIAGETSHDQYIAQAVTQGLTAITVRSGVPIAFGVLTCDSLKQAQARSMGPSARRADGRAIVNKGAEAMRAAISAANTVRRLRAPKGLRT